MSSIDSATRRAAFAPGSACASGSAESAAANQSLFAHQSRASRSAARPLGESFAAARASNAHGRSVAQPPHPAPPRTASHSAGALATGPTATRATHNIHLAQPAWHGVPGGCQVDARCTVSPPMISPSLTNPSCACQSARTALTGILRATAGFHPSELCSRRMRAVAEFTVIDSACGSSPVGAAVSAHISAIGRGSAAHSVESAERCIVAATHSG